MTRPFRLGALLAALLPLSACTPPIRVAADQPVTVTRIEYVALPPALTAPCAAPVDAGTTNGALLDAYLADAASLAACGARLDAIRKLQPAGKP